MFDWQIKTFSQLTIDELYAVLRLRSEIFVMEQNCVYLDLDGKDQKSCHILCYDDGKLVAYMRLLPVGVESETMGSLGRVVVAKEYRGRGLGHQLVDKGLEAYCDFVGKDVPIIIHAQSQLEKFYGEHGFVCVSERYLFEGLMHTNMVKQNK
ncbi:MAG: GNAT family N-acetyltransferase [Bacteroidales bacterium]|nr:GNAT family N-acetyltransferase [Bacteroidales bacterium]